MRINYINYFFKRPFHSYRYKQLRRQAQAFAHSQNMGNSVLRELAEYTGQDIDALKEKYDKLCTQAAVMNCDILSEEELRHIYRNDEHYVYELPVLNASCGRSMLMFWVIAPYLKHHKCRDVMDFGAGSGDFCIVLAREGFNVSYMDISRKLIEFAGWRFKKLGLDVRIVEETEASVKRFDCVTAFDVFEHLKNLPVRLLEIGKFVKAGGSLIFNIETGGDGLHLAENKIYNRAKALDKVLRDAGFVFSWRFKKFFFYKKTANQP